MMSLTRNMAPPLRMKYPTLPSRSYAEARRRKKLFVGPDMGALDRTSATVVLVRREMPAPRQKLYRSVLDVLLNSAEPSIQWKVRSGVMNEDPRSKDMRALREEVRNSARVSTLLAHRDKKGRLVRGRGVYDKWQGAHWILAALADLGYPEGDKA